MPGPQKPTVEVLPVFFFFEPTALKKYMTVKSENGQSIVDLDILYVHRSLVQAWGREPKVIPQRDDPLLVEIAFPEEATRPSALTGVPGFGVSCTPHATFKPRQRSTLLQWPPPLL